MSTGKGGWKMRRGKREKGSRGDRKGGGVEKEMNEKNDRKKRNERRMESKIREGRDEERRGERGRNSTQEPRQVQRNHMPRLEQGEGGTGDERSKGNNHRYGEGKEGKGKQWMRSPT